MKCPDCGTVVIQVIHEGTGQKILFLPGGITPHQCVRMKYCIKCGISVIDNGKHDHKKFEQRTKGLDKFI